MSKFSPELVDVEKFEMYRRLVPEVVKSDPVLLRSVDGMNADKQEAVFRAIALRAHQLNSGAPQEELTSAVTVSRRGKPMIHYPSLRIGYNWIRRAGEFRPERYSQLIHHVAIGVTTLIQTMG